MMTATASPTAIFTSGAGMYFLNRCCSGTSGCARTTLTTASSILTTSNAMLSFGPAWAMTSLPDGPALGNHEQPASSSASSQPQRTTRFISAMRRFPAPSRCNTPASETKGRLHSGAPIFHLSSEGTEPLSRHDRGNDTGRYVIAKADHVSP